MSSIVISLYMSKQALSSQLYPNKCGICIPVTTHPSGLHVITHELDTIEQQHAHNSVSQSADEVTILNMGNVGKQLGVNAFRLFKEIFDLMRTDVIDPLIFLVNQNPGIFIWGSLPSTVAAAGNT